MNNSRTRKKLLLLGTLLVLSSVVTMAIYTQASKLQKKQKECPCTYEAATVTEAPEVVSMIKGLEITGVTLINQGTPLAALNIDVTNKRDEDVMAIDFIAGKDTTSGHRIDGLLEEDKPSVIIRRQSLRTFTWYLSAIMEGGTIRLAAAVFSDGKEEGEKWFLEGMKKSRLQYQQRRREERAKNGGQQ